MNKLLKKTVAILMCLTFLLSAVTISCAVTIQNEKTNDLEENVLNEAAIETKEISVYRYGPDGTITSKKVTIKLEKGKDIGEAIANLCEELTNNDPEIQAAAKDNRTNITLLTKIWSVGKGFHFKTTMRLQFIQKFKLFPLLPPYFRTAIPLPIVYCKYSKDPQAKTVIKPSLIKANNVTIEGPHNVLCLGFIGYKGWIGHISYLGFLIKVGFAGFTGLAITKTW